MEDKMELPIFSVNKNKQNTNNINTLDDTLQFIIKGLYYNKTELIINYIFY